MQGVFSADFNMGTKRQCFRQPTFPKCQGAAYFTGVHTGPPQSEMPPLIALIIKLMFNTPETVLKKSWVS